MLLAIWIPSIVPQNTFFSTLYFLVCPHYITSICVRLLIMERPTIPFPPLPHPLSFPAMCPYFIKHTCPVTGYGAESVPFPAFFRLSSLLFVRVTTSRVSVSGSYLWGCLDNLLSRFFSTLFLLLAMLREGYQWRVLVMVRYSVFFYCYFLLSVLVTTSKGSGVVLVMGKRSSAFSIVLLLLFCYF